VKLHPFTPERQIGIIYQVEGSFADVTFSAAGKLPRSHFGEYVGRGEVGEFVIIDVGGTAAFGRLLRVGATTNSIAALSQPERQISAEGRIQLLSTLQLDGHATRGILQYPKVGDPVYAANSESILAVLGTGTSDSQAKLSLGRLSVDESIEVSVPLSRLFGRHLAIVGATGSGKSWTLGHLAESVGQAGGKMLLIDATGEFHTLGSQSSHLAFGSIADEPAGTRLVGIPHYMMRESDRNAFLNPSTGTQLPKLRDAVRSLKLATAIGLDDDADPDHKALVAADGTIGKAEVQMSRIGAASRKYTAAMEDVHAPFDIKLVAKQIQWECVWPTSRNAPDCFGGLDLDT
jgi:hypothetical protein